MCAAAGRGECNGVSEQSDGTVQQMSAQWVLLFVWQAPSLVLGILCVFLCDVQFEHGVMESAFGGCSIRQCVSMPQRDRHAIVQQCTWLKSLAKHLALPPNTSNVIVPSAVPCDGLGVNTPDCEPHTQLFHNRHRRRRNQH